MSCSVPTVDAQEGENKAEGILLIWSAPETKHNNIFENVDLVF